MSFVEAFRFNQLTFSWDFHKFTLFEDDEAEKKLSTLQSFVEST